MTAIRFRPALLGILALVFVWTQDSAAEPADTCKPLPGTEVRWESPADPAPGTRVTVTAVVTSRFPDNRVRLEFLVPEGLRVIGFVPEVDAVVSPDSPLRVPVTVVVPGPDDPAARLTARARVGARNGSGYRVGSHLFLGNRPTPVLPDPERVTTLEGPALQYVARPLDSGVASSREALRALDAAPAQQINVSGAFVFRNREIGPDGFVNANLADDPVTPARQARVELLRDGAVVSTGITATDGSFAFTVDDLGGAYTARLTSRINPGTVDIRVLKSAAQPEAYAVIAAGGPAAPGPAQGDVDLGTFLVEAGQGAEAFNVLDAVFDGALLFESVTGGPPALPLTVYWNPASTTGTNYQAASNTINLLADEGWDDSVIIHEYGHYVSLEYSHDESPGGLHFVDDSNQDPRLSWGEGWASFWQSAARAAAGSTTPTWYVDTTGLPGAGNLYFSFDCEEPSYNVIGLASETVVQALLWDIVDDAATPDPFPGVDDDPLTRPLTEVWAVMAGPMLTATGVTLEDFWDGWFHPSVANGFVSEMEQTFAALGVELFPDALEDDDPIVAAVPLVVDGSTVHHTFHGVGDLDHHRFDLEPGETVTVETLNLLGWADTRIRVFHPDLTLLAENDNRSEDPLDFSSRVSFTASQSGSHLVEIARVKDIGSCYSSPSTMPAGCSGFTEYGSYDVRAVEGTPNAIPLPDVAQAVGVASLRFGAGGAFGDYDADGDLDLVVVNNPPGDQDHLYRNFTTSGNGLFSDVATGAGMSGGGGGVAAAWADYDNDGDLDLFVTDHALWRNQGNGTFVDFSAGSGVVDRGREFDAAWADVDRDGLLDLFVAVRDGDPVLWHNQGDGTFVDVTAGAGFGFPGTGENAYGCVFGDYDGDGFPDLFVAFNGPRGHALFRNQGDGTFTETTMAAGLSTLDAAVGGAWGDVDNDGRLDLFVASARKDKLYLNQGDGTFVNEAARYGVAEDKPSRGSGFADYDLDGDLDLFVVHFNDSHVLYENTGDAMVTAVVPAMATGHAAAWGDYDGDGDPDVYVPVQSSRNLLLRNGPGAPVNSWLHVDPEGQLSNRDGRGAVIRVWSGGTVQVREYGTGDGWAAKSRGPAIFGLGEGGTVDSVRVDWPSGAWNVVAAPAVNQVLGILEDTATPVRPVPGHPALVLGPAMPNPFSAATQVRFTLGEATPVRVRVHDVAGRVVAVLHDGPLGAGEHLLGWDGRDAGGRDAGAGVYFYRVQAGEELRVRKLVRIE